MLQIEKKNLFGPSLTILSVIYPSTPIFTCKHFSNVMNNIIFEKKMDVFTCSISYSSSGPPAHNISVKV